MYFVVNSVYSWQVIHIICNDINSELYNNTEIYLPPKKSTAKQKSIFHNTKQYFKAL